MERTLVIIKPDGVARHLVGEIINRYERKDFKLLAAKLIAADALLLENHYAEHKGRAYFQELIDYMSEGPIMVMAWAGASVVEIIRLMNGDKHPSKASPGTIRGDYAHDLTKNIVHASDSPETAEREIAIWFPELA
ncbi:nucleoside-diphosphate kinase [Anaerosolibacter carboniphilus]|uniref:Nucleoside diphosphate kinase n=1 Tax=Anaerosolibacter carboniphilus TaxID=1417629 RepID=A0A841L0H4_9FIRM|nr:nucleoside-diphosphate kinase [Anaerosolibacter carboniphilus]